MHPDNNLRFRSAGIDLIPLASNQWADLATSITEPRMSEFRENLAVVIENNFHRGFVRGCGIVVRSKMLHSSGRRKHIATRFRNMFGYTARRSRRSVRLGWWYGPTVRLHHDKPDNA